MTKRALPGWVVDEDASIRVEVEPYLAMSPAELWEATRACARAAVWALGFHERPEEALAHVDPLPASTEAALARLRSRR